MGCVVVCRAGHAEPTQRIRRRGDARPGCALCSPSMHRHFRRVGGARRWVHGLSQSTRSHGCGTAGGAVQTDYGTTGVLFVDMVHFGPVAIRRSAFHQVGQFSVDTCPDACANTALHDLSRRMWQQQLQVRASRLGSVMCAACVRLADGHGGGLSRCCLAQVGVLNGPPVAPDVRSEPCGVPTPTPPYVVDAMRRAQVLFAYARDAVAFHVAWLPARLPHGHGMSGC